MARRLRAITMFANDLDSALAAWRSGIGLIASELGPTTDSEERRATIVVADVDLDISSPATPTSPLARVIGERGEGLFSLTIEVDDFDTLVAGLRAKGVVMSAPEETRDGLRSVMIDRVSSRGVPIRLVEIKR